MCHRLRDITLSSNGLEMFATVHAFPSVRAEKAKCNFHYFGVLICMEKLSFSQGFLPPANEVWGKVMFLHLSVILFTGGRRGFS